MANYLTRPSREVYQDFEKALDKCEGNFIAQRSISKRYGQYLVSAEAENFIRVALVLYSRFIDKLVCKLEGVMGPRPALKLAARIQAATFWSPEPFTDIFNLTLASSSVLGFAFEKAVGKTKADKLFSAAKKPFQALSFSVPACIKKPLNIALKKAYEGTQSLQKSSQSAYEQSACVTVFGHHDKTLHFGNDSMI